MTLVRDLEIGRRLYCGAHFFDLFRRELAKNYEVALRTLRERCGIDAEPIHSKIERRLGESSRRNHVVVELGFADRTNEVNCAAGHRERAKGEQRCCDQNSKLHNPLTDVRRGKKFYTTESRA